MDQRHRQRCSWQFLIGETVTQAVRAVPQPVSGSARSATNHGYMENNSGRDAEPDGIARKLNETMHGFVLLLYNVCIPVPATLRGNLQRRKGKPPRNTDEL